MEFMTTTKVGVIDLVEGSIIFHRIRMTWSTAKDTTKIARDGIALTISLKMMGMACIEVAIVNLNTRRIQANKALVTLEEITK